MFKVLIRKEPDGTIVVHTSEPDAHISIFDVNSFVRAVGLDETNKAYLKARNFVLEKPFSVLLQYPDGQTYYAWVTALDAEGAVEAAKVSYMEDNLIEREDLPDFEVLLVVKGHIDAELRKEDN